MHLASLNISDHSPIFTILRTSSYPAPDKAKIIKRGTFLGFLRNIVCDTFLLYNAPNKAYNNSFLKVFSTLYDIEIPVKEEKVCENYLK